MKKELLLCICLVFNTLICIGQDVSCDDLMAYVKKNGRLKGTISQIQLINSSWLKGVVAYSVDNTIVVIAEIKQDEYGFSTKKYVFCGIPSSNWDSFYSTYTDIGKTYGEKFNKYIMDYKCNCE